MSVNSIYHWQQGQLRRVDEPSGAAPPIVAADSWLVVDGGVRALDLHRRRFFDAIESGRFAPLVSEGDLVAFWTAAVGTIPITGDFFPRVELTAPENDLPVLAFRLRSAPERSRSVRLASHPGDDPRRSPTIKGPDTDNLLQARALAQTRGADEAVILSPEGYVVEGAYSALLWWRGNTLCAPTPTLAKIDSITARTVVTLATALGVDVHYESVSPGELEGLEIWALSALQGIRIVTHWVDGPSTAEDPGRLVAWRRRLDRLRQRVS